MNDIQKALADLSKALTDKYSDGGANFSFCVDSVETTSFSSGKRQYIYTVFVDAEYADHHSPFGTLD